MDCAIQGPCSKVITLAPKRNKARPASSFGQQYKCQPCRKLKQKCYPERRVWPAKCSHCINKDLLCSAPALSNGSIAPWSIVGDSVLKAQSTIHEAADQVTTTFASHGELAPGKEPEQKDDTFVDQKEHPSHIIPVSTENGAKRPSSTILPNPSKHRRQFSPVSDEKMVVELQGLPDPTPSYVSTAPQIISVGSNIAANMNDSDEHHDAVFLAGTMTTKEAVGPYAQPQIALPSVPTQYDRFHDLKLNLLDLTKWTIDDKERVKPTADLLAAFGQLERSCFLYLLLYREKRQRRKKAQGCLTILLAASRSVTNKRDADLVEALILERLSELRDLRDQAYFDTSNLSYNKDQRVFAMENAKLSAVLHTLQLRVLAATLSHTKFDKTKSERWRRQVEDAISQIKPTGHGLDERDLNLISLDTGTNDIISPCLLSNRILLIEHVDPSPGEEIRKISSPYWIVNATRIQAIQRAFSHCAVPSKKQILVSAKFFMDSQSITFPQGAYLALYSALWTALRFSEKIAKDSRAHVSEDLCGCTSAETIKLIIKVVMHDLPSMPTSFLDIPERRKQELWVEQLSSRLSRLAKSSVEILSSWLSERIKATPFAIPEQAVLNFVVDHTGIDVSIIPILAVPLADEPKHSDAAARGPGTIENSSLPSATSPLIKSSVDVPAIKNVKKKLVRDSILSPIDEHQLNATTATFDHDFVGVDIPEEDRIKSPRDSTISNSSFKQFMKLAPLRSRLSTSSQELQLPSSVMRRSQRSDWSMFCDSMSDLSRRFSKASISTKNSRRSRIDIVDPDEGAKGRDEEERVWNDVDDAGQELMLAMDIAFQSSLEEDLAANTTSGDKHTARGDARVFNFGI